MESNPMKQTQQKMATRNILLFPIPLQGHLTPMLHLASLLHSKSFSITIIQTRLKSLDPTRFPHFTFHFLEDDTPMKTKLSTNNIAPALSEIIESCEAPFRVCLTRILTDACAKQDPFSCLITDSLWFFARSVAESLNIPRIVLRTSSLSAFVVNDSLPVFLEKGYFLPDTNPDEAVQETPPFKVKDLPKEDHHELLASVVQQTKTAHAVICNSFDELEGPSIAKVRQLLSDSTPLFPIGPLHKHSPTHAPTIPTQDQTAITWLNTQAPNSVLYVSFGTVATMTKTDFVEIAWGIANSKQPFLWVVRPGLSQGSEGNDLLPEGYLEMVNDRGLIVKWAPQVKVLLHPAVGGFLTHCGWNSTVEGVSAGVPMLCFPFFADQAMNTRYINDVWRIGVQLEKGMRRDDIENAIRKLMAGVEGEEMRSRAATLKQCAIQCLAEGGSSHRSLESLISYLLSL